MVNSRLDGAVERLLTDRRFLGRFRSDPERALARYELSTEEVEAIKRGDAEELVGLGLNPAIAWPQPANPGAMQSWLMRNVGRLAPAAFLAALALAWPGASQAEARKRPRTVPGLARASRALARAGVRGRARSIVARREENIRPGPGEIEN